jgi:uracil-DNA glycosylase family 4
VHGKRDSVHRRQRKLHRPSPGSRHPNKEEIFITNVVHCHPPDDRPSHRHEIDNCRRFLHGELDVVQPRLTIGLGADAKTELLSSYLDGNRLSWPFVEPRAYRQGATYLLFPEHPGSLRFKKTADRAYYAPSLARAIKWSFDLR